MKSMKSKFQEVKDYKRRTVETLLEKTGFSDRSVDLEYEESRLCFERMVDEIHELGGGMTEYIHTSREMFNTCDKDATRFSTIRF